MQIDFYTTVIDNYWDCWFSFNLAVSLLYYYPELKIRYFCDNKDLFLKLKWDKEIKNIIYYDLKEIKNIIPSKTIFNFFDRKIDFDYFHLQSFDINLINFSYFLMHAWVNSLHNTKYVSKNVFVTHFVPSLISDAWWIIVNPYLEEFREEILKKDLFLVRKEFLPNLDDEKYKKKWVSIFCYKQTFEKIKGEFKKYPNIIFFTFDNKIKGENVVNMPFLKIDDYYKFQYLCDKNIVRWENSLINSLFTQKPFLWDIYKEHNEAHKEKIKDFSQYLVSTFWQSFDEYNHIFSDFNIWDVKSSFFKFLNYENDFKKIQENINNDLVKNIRNYIYQ